MSRRRKKLQPARILGIETSCDETAAAVVENGRAALSNVVASQAELHVKYGGVFPEVASRQHIKVIDTVVAEALAQAHLELADVDAIAVTRGHEDRPLGSEEYERLREAELSSFLQTLREKYSWTINEEGWQAMSPEDPDIPVQAQLQ